MIDFRKSTVLYGGSFDPVHNGHLHVARECLRLKPEVEQMLFVPAYQSPDKQSTQASSADRLHFLELALHGTNFKSWSYEIQRHHPSFTIDTLKEAHRLGAKKEHLFWLMGADAYLNFEKWKSFEEIRELCRLLVVHRPDYLAHSKDPEDILLPIRLHGTSSTQLREQLAKGLLPPGELPDALEKHLHNLHLQGKNPYASLKI